MKDIVDTFINHIYLNHVVSKCQDFFLNAYQRLEQNKLSYNIFFFVKRIIDCSIFN